VYDGNNYGMFGIFMITLGMLDSYDRGEISGCEVNFGKTGFYYEKNHGPNWWEYYFLPVRTNHVKGAPIVHFSDGQVHHDFCIRGTSRLTKDRCHELISKYVVIRQEFLDEVDSFLKEHVGEEGFVGVHYRGTDKFISEADPITPETTCEMVKNLIHERGLSSTKIFAASDDAHFIEVMQRTFGDKVFFFEMERSSDNQPIHSSGTSDGFTKGKMALLDCLVLSKSSLLIRTSSSLSHASLLMSPDLPVIRLNNSRMWGER
jgi:hypothetical protein